AKEEVHLLWAQSKRQSENVATDQWHAGSRGRIHERPIRIEALVELRARVAPPIERRRSGPGAVVVNQAAALVIFRRGGVVAAAGTEIHAGQAANAPVGRVSIAISN